MEQALYKSLVYLLTYLLTYKLLVDHHDAFRLTLKTHILHMLVAIFNAQSICFMLLQVGRSLVDGSGLVPTRLSAAAV